MKSMTKLMVVAMLLVAALVVAPAAARTYVGPDPIDKIGNYTIENGDTVYVGEQNLNFAAATFTDAGTAPTIDDLKGARLVHYTNLGERTYDKAVTISDPNDFELTSSDFGSITGTYHVFTKGSSITTRTSTCGTVYGIS